MTHGYFNALNYSLANEDTSLEIGILPLHAKHAISVCGSGSRVLALAANSPQKITCVDVSPGQLALADLRFAAARSLELPEFLSLFGYAGSDARMSREALFTKIRPLMDPDHAETMKKYWEGIAWNRILYQGKWEKTIIKLSQMIRKLLGSEVDGLFECRTIPEQVEYFQRHISGVRWNLLVMLLGNAPLFNALLYKGHFPKRNIPGTAYGFYRDVFKRLFSTQLARQNYFMQLLFLGELRFPEGNPVECHESVFKRVKGGAQGAEVSYEVGDIFSIVGNSVASPADFVSLSDVPSYLGIDRGKTFLKEMLTGVAKGGIIVSRYYLHVPQNIQTEGLKDVTVEYDQLIQNEGVQVYQVQVFKRL
jgi:S-adenosylmethionine-diacylglycerol 3-amino-3-carboxypropyl transferase